MRVNDFDVIEANADEFFQDIWEEAMRRVDQWLADREPLPPCFELSQEKYEAAVIEQFNQLFHGWVEGDFV